MSKHTPGPWILVGSEVHDRPTRFDDDGVRIGETPCMIASASIMPNKGQREANARLIAAAPELLDMLVQCRCDFAVLPRALGYDFTHLPKLDALIAKATGEPA